MRARLAVPSGDTAPGSCPHRDRGMAPRSRSRRRDEPARQSWLLAFIVTDIDHAHFLGARDGHTLTFQIAQSEGPFLISVLEVQRGGEGECVRLVLPDVSPRSNSNARRVHLLST